MKQRNLFPLIVIFLLSLVLAACGGEGESDGLTEDQRVETRAAEIVQATADFEAAVEQEIAARSTTDAANNPPTEPPPTSTNAPPPTEPPATATPNPTELPTAVAEEPTPVEATDSSEEVQPTPTLFPLVKQGAPGDRQGIEGNVFAPEGLQISSDPPIFGHRISFMGVGFFDATAGEEEGEGVDSVTFTITNENGDVVHRLVEETPYYCAFGGSSPCAGWNFSANNNEWPSGFPAESGKYFTKIEASGTDSGRFSIWTYDFELDLGDTQVVVAPPQPTPTLFPMVKQGAPGDRQGIEGSVFAPGGLQISEDPAVYGQQISFLLVGAFDENVGTNEGDGVASVTFTISDQNGTVVYRKQDDVPLYCAFGGDNPCNVWDFSQNNGNWPDGTPASSGDYNVLIEASGTKDGRFSIWTYDFALDFGDTQAAPPPTPTLFPVVKQGAPSQKNGVLGNVYAPAGLQISSDPAIFGNGISFMLLDAYDDAAGSTVEGTGIEKVVFKVFDSDGNLVYQRDEANPLYCAFGGDGPCNVWNFAANGNVWPGGTPVKSGDYKATVEAFGTTAGKSSLWNYEFAIDVGDVSSAPPPASVTITNITLSGDRYAVEFFTSGYTPALPGMHMHFFFDTVAADQAGAPGGGPWQIYPNANGGAASSPMTLYGPGDRPGGANRLCVLVANPNHSVNQGTGNCFPLP